MYIIEKENGLIEKIVIGCSKKGCNGVHTLNRYRDDMSPRIESECPECNSFMSKKLSNVGESEIIKREWI